MRAPITDKHLLEMMWERFPEIMQRGAEQPAQQEEPVAIVDGDDHGYFAEILPDRSVKVGQLLYTSPPAQRTWVGLTDEEIRAEEFDHIRRRDFARAIEAKLKEKNT